MVDHKRRTILNFKFIFYKINFHTNQRNVRFKFISIENEIRLAIWRKLKERNRCAFPLPFAGSRSSPFRDTKVVLETKSIVSSTRESTTYYTPVARAPLNARPDD